MRLIDKDFKIITIPDAALSAYSNNKYSIVSEKIIFAFDSDGLEIITPAKNIKGINLQGYEDNFQICTDLIEYSDLEKIEIENAKIETERKNTFSGCNIKLVVDYKFALTNLNAFVLQCTSDDDIDCKVTTVQNTDENDIIISSTKTATISLYSIEQADYNAIKTLIDSSIIIVSTIDNDDIEIKIDGKYKYIIPQI